MSGKLPAVTSKKFIRALKKAGFEVDHQAGSHVTLLRATDRRRVTVPMHNRDLGTGLLHKLIADAGLSRDEFRELL